MLVQKDLPCRNSWTQPQILGRKSKHDPRPLENWQNEARSSVWGRIAPFVISVSGLGDLLRKNRPLFQHRVLHLQKSLRSLKFFSPRVMKWSGTFVHSQLQTELKLILIQFFTYRLSLLGEKLRILSIMKGKCLLCIMQKVWQQQLSWPVRRNLKHFKKGRCEMYLNFFFVTKNGMEVVTLHCSKLHWYVVR